MGLGQITHQTLVSPSVWLSVLYNMRITWKWNDTKEIARWTTRF